MRVYFLNEWGDLQLVPYQRKRTNLTGSPEPETPKAKTSGTPLERYAIVVSEEKLQSYSFPGCVKIESCSLPLSDGGAILQSDYFTCKGESIQLYCQVFSRESSVAPLAFSVKNPLM